MADRTASLKTPIPVAQTQAASHANATPSSDVPPSTTDSSSFEVKTSFNSVVEMPVQHLSPLPDSIPGDNGHHPGPNTKDYNESEKARPICTAQPRTVDDTDKLLTTKKHNARSSLQKLRRTATPILLCALAMCLLATVITYVQATYAAEERSSQGYPLTNLLKTDFSRTLTILRTSQGILSALMTLALENVFALLQWSNVYRPSGIPYLNILALSPTTGALGTLGLVRSPAPRVSAKLWAVLRQV